MAGKKKSPKNAETVIEDATEIEQPEVPEDQEPNAEVGSDAAGDEDDSLPPAEAATDQESEDETTPDEGDVAPEDEESVEATDTPSDLNEPEVETPSEDTSPDSTSSGAWSEPATTTVVERKGGFWPMLTGGVVAAALGYGASHYGLLQQSSPSDETDKFQSDTEQTLETHLGAITDLQSKVTGLEGGVDLSGLESAQTALSARIDALVTSGDDLKTRLEALEARPIGGDGGDLPAGAYGEELAKLKEALAAQSAQVLALTNAADAQEEAARQSAKATLQRAAMTRIQTALDTGSRFDAALADLEATGLSAPDTLHAVASDGVPSLAALSASFPDAARSVLAVTRAEDPNDGSGGFWSFLGEQLGARSLEPREGTDPDAILSRAEAAVRDGRLMDAMAEIETLPDAGRAEMAGWVNQATLRQTAVEAVEALNAGIN